MLTPKQILDELDRIGATKKMVIKTRYSKIKDLEEYSPDEEKIKKYYDNFYTRTQPR